MDLPFDGTFWTILAVVVSAISVQLVARADRRRERQEFEQRREAGEKRLSDQIGGLKLELSRRMDRMEDRFNEKLQEVKAELAEVKAEMAKMKGEMAEMKAEMAVMKSEMAVMKGEISALSARLDERSYPRRLREADLPTAGESVAQGVGVRETTPRYSGGPAATEADEEAPEIARRNPREGNPK